MKPKKPRKRIIERGYATIGVAGIWWSSITGDEITARRYSDNIRQWYEKRARLIEVEIREVLPSKRKKR